MNAAAELVHPRDAVGLERIDFAADAFESALASGRMHHAWLLTGPKGVGKASFAYRMACRLLGGRPAPGSGPLGSAPDDPVHRLVSARAHPDLLVLEPGGEDGKSSVISVEDARLAPVFFSKARAIAPFRVVIVDAVDDMNVAAANAVLKTLEEPPEKGVLLLVSHAPGRLLPTIRSRCRRLAFPPWPDESIAAFAEARLRLDGEEAGRLAGMIRGAPGRALTLHAAGVLDVDATVRELIEALPSADLPSLAKLADGLRGAEAVGRFGLLMDRLGEAARERAEIGRGEAAERWVRAWTRLASLHRQVEGLNSDRVEAFWAAIAELRAAAEAAPC